MNPGSPFDREPATSDGVEARSAALACREREPREDALHREFMRELGKLLEIGKKS